MLEEVLAVCDRAEAASVLAMQRAQHSGEIRRIVAAAKRRNPDELAELDEAICADVGKLEDLGADGVVEEAFRFLQRQPPDLAEAAEKRAYDRRFLAFQPALDGSGSGYFELPPVEFAQVTGRINAEAEQLHDSDEHDRKSWGHARADALVSRWSPQVVKCHRHVWTLQSWSTLTISTSS